MKLLLGCYYSLLQKAGRQAYAKSHLLWKSFDPTHNYLKKQQLTNGTLFTKEHHPFESTNRWKQLLKGSLFIFAPCLAAVVLVGSKNTIWNEPEASSSTVPLRKLDSKDLLEAAKEAADAIERKSNCILNLYSVASRSPSFNDMKERKESAMEALSLADRWVNKLQSYLRRETQCQGSYYWSKWLVDVASVSVAFVLLSCIHFVFPGLCHRGMFSYWPKPFSFAVRQHPIWIVGSCMVSLVGYFIFASWNSVDNIYSLFTHNLKQNQRDALATLHVEEEELSHWEEGVQDKNVRHALLQLEKASSKEQDAMEKYNVLQNIVSAPLSKEEQRLLEEYQYRISQAQEEIANSEAQWNRWMLGIRRLDILEAIGLSAAARIAQLCDEYDRYDRLNRGEMGLVRCWANLGSFSLACLCGKCTDKFVQARLGDGEQDTSLSCIWIGWIFSLLLKDLLEVVKDYRRQQELLHWKERAQQRLKDWMEFRSPQDDFSKKLASS